MGGVGWPLSPWQSTQTPTAAPSAGENSVYRIAPDGTVRELYRDKTMVLRLMKLDGRLLVATGMQGQLFAVDETTKERTELTRVEAGQINALVRRADGGPMDGHEVTIGLSAAAKLRVLEGRADPSLFHQVPEQARLAAAR